MDLDTSTLGLDKLCFINKLFGSYIIVGTIIYTLAKLYYKEYPSILFILSLIFGGLLVIILLQGICTISDPLEALSIIIAIWLSYYITRMFIKEFETINKDKENVD